HLAHVEMDVLAALGDGAIDRPDRGVSSEQRQNGAFPARRVEKGIEQALEPWRLAKAADGAYLRHRRCLFDWRAVTFRGQAQALWHAVPMRSRIAACHCFAAWGCDGKSRLGSRFRSRPWGGGSPSP